MGSCVVVGRDDGVSVGLAAGVAVGVAAGAAGVSVAGIAGSMGTQPARNIDITITRPISREGNLRCTPAHSVPVSYNFA